LPSKLGQLGDVARYAPRLVLAADRLLIDELIQSFGREKRASRLSTAYAKLTMAFLTIPLKGMGGHHAPSEETLEAEASGMRGTVVGGRRVVVVAGERRICGNRGARSGYANAEHHSEQ
jgi:hypothetical protein